MVSRPYEYNLTWKWCGDSLSLDISGFRTDEDGKRQNLDNRAYDDKDPAPAIKLEKVMYQAFGGGTNRSKSPLGSVEKIVMTLRGDQAKEQI